MEIAGGLYRELCEVPFWNAVFGSGGRAAATVASLSPGSVLHTYGDNNNMSAWNHLVQLGVKLEIKQTDTSFAFAYFHPLSKPFIEPTPNSHPKQPSLQVYGKTVLRFGMLEGDATVDADRAIYDPQSACAADSFGANGSKASQLALIMNETEAQSIDQARSMLVSDKASAVVVKQGPRGATVLGPDYETHIPAYRSTRIFKIGSGDVFSAVFAHYWGEIDLSPAEAADRASRLVAAYCDTQSFPGEQTNMGNSQPVKSGPAGPILLEGAVNTIGRRYAVEEARFRLEELGMTVFAPVLGDRPDSQVPTVTLRIADGLRTSINTCRKQRTIVILDEQRAELKTNSQNESVIVTDDFVTALYFAAWEAMGVNPCKNEGSRIH